MRFFRRAFIGATITLALGSATAASADPRNIYSIHTVNSHKLAQDCGPSSNVGNSSVFGSYQEWSNKFPTLGQASAEIEAIKIIDGSSKRAARQVFADAQSKKLAIWRSMNVSDTIVRRGENNYQATQNIHSDTMEKYGANTEKLEKESLFVTQKAMRDVETVLKENGNGYDVWQACKQYWSGYSSHNRAPRGRYGNSNSNQWWQ